MSSLDPGSPTKEKPPSPVGVDSTVSSYGSTHSDVERNTNINEGDDDGPPLSFADLGIPTGPQLQNTTTGKRRRLQDLEKKEIAFVIIALVAILATTVFTIYKLATVGTDSPDFVFALVLIVNAVFCGFYLVHGVLKERPYEIFILVAATIVITLYLIINFAVGTQGTVKLIRLIAACCFGPVIIVLGIIIGKEYLESGNLVFKTVGANASLQSMCRTMFLFLDLLKIDLQLGITMVILIMVNAANINTLDIVVLAVGIVVTVTWFILGHASVRQESKPITFIFWAMSPLELAYILYKIVKASERLSTAATLAAVSLTAGVLAALTRIGVIVLTYFVFRNYGYGLKEKAFGVQ